MGKKLRDAVLKGKYRPVPHCPYCDAKLVNPKNTGLTDGAPNVCLRTAFCPVPCNPEDSEFCIKWSGKKLKLEMSEPGLDN